MILTGNQKLAACIFALGTMMFFSGVAKADDAGDSTSHSTLVINPRIHSSGYFPFTGVLLNRNPVADVNVFYEKKALGFFLFQSADLVDRHSYANYLQPGIFATIRPQVNLRFRLFFGYIFSQTQGFCDPESDYYVAGQVNWALSGKFRIENTLLFYDFSNGKKLANRLLLEYSVRKFRVSGYLFQRSELEKSMNATSGMLSVTFPIVKVSRKVNLELTSSYMGYLTSVKPDFALQDGFFLTLAAPMNIK